MKVRVEGGGHCVEIEINDAEMISAKALTRLAERTWMRTKSPERQQIGYAGQLTERTHDRPVQGAGDYQRQVRPVTA